MTDGAHTPAAADDTQFFRAELIPLSVISLVSVFVKDDSALLTTRTVMEPAPKKNFRTTTMFAAAMWRISWRTEQCIDELKVDVNFGPNVQGSFLPSC